MTERVDLQEFVGAFVAEADELIASSNALLLEIEAANAAGVTSKPRAVRDLFRALHTLKGLAGMIGIEPIVEIAHALETVLRIADRSGGVLGPTAVDAAIHGVAAIGERVQAVAAGREVAAAPRELVEAIDAADHAPAPPPPVFAVSPEWDARLKESEKQQLAAAVAAGGRAWTVTFVPAEDKAARGITIASVRERVSAIAELVKVQPRSTPGGPSSIAFDLLVVGAASAAALAEAAAVEVTQLVCVGGPPESPATAPPGTHPGAVPAAATQAPRAGELARELADELPPEAVDAAPIGRALVRVELARLDDLQEQLSAMIVSRFRLERELAALAATGSDTRRLREVADVQARQLRDLRRAILRARMVRVSEVLDPLPLLVRSLARAQGKEIRFEQITEGAELDKAVADRLLPALVHLVRNAVDHAIEVPDERVARGKPRAATIRVRCSDLGGNRLEIVIEDDGRGIDREHIARRAGRPISSDRDLLAALATPGFSTRDVATRTSGRGLGMDIVQRIAVDVLGGDLSLATELGVGTAFTLRVPLTIAVVDVFSFECGDQAFVVPVATVDEIFELPVDLARPPRGSGGSGAAVQIVERHGRAVAVLSLGETLHLSATGTPRKGIVIQRGGEPVAFAVDRMLGRHEVVVRAVDDPLVRVPGITGATDLGSGRPTLVLDLAQLSLGGAAS